jgi:tetratricopeptide (TPR) repeat protein
MKAEVNRLAPLILLAFLTSGSVQAQRGLTLWGDVKIDDSEADTPAPLSVTIILYEETGKVVGRQNVPSRGRYRFTGVPVGRYELAVEANEREITRMSISLVLSSDIGIRQDFEFKWKPNAGASKPANGVTSAADVYSRSPANKSVFRKAQEAVEKKKYDQAVLLLKQILDNDHLDFQVWTLLGTVYLTQERPEEAEKSYMQAIEVKPVFVLALIHLGSLRSSQKRFAEAIEPLAKAVELQPHSPEANLLLGEAYIHIKNGSRAIPYLNEAAQLGRVEAHLDLAWLYNAAGMKDKAAAEYEAFIKKKPDYPDRKKLEQYIRVNKQK